MYGALGLHGCTDGAGAYYCYNKKDVTVSHAIEVFEWDWAKAEANLRKHGVDFDTAIHVFGDPFAIVRQDRIEGGE